MLLGLLLLPGRLWAQAEVTRIVLPTGLRVVAQPDSNSDVVAICVFVRAGLAEEEGKSGIGDLTARSLFGSNTNQSSDAVNRAIYAVGGSLETFWNPDYTQITCVTTRDSFEDAFYVIAQALKCADFEPDTLARARQQVEADIARETGDPYRAAYAALRARLYTDSPYRLPISGSSDVLKRLTAEQVRRFYETRYTPKNTVIAIVGNVTLERVRKAVQYQLLPDYDRPAARPAFFPAQDAPFSPGRVARKMDTHTTMVLAGFAAPAVTDPDYPAFCALTALIGGGKGSRLFRTVRDTVGVGYSVGAYTPTLAHPSHLVAYVEFDPSRAGVDGKPLAETAVEKLLTDTAKSPLKTPPTAQELERAKHYAAGTHLLGHQRARDRAAYLGRYEALGAGWEMDRELPDKIEAVTQDDIARVARKYLENCVVSVVEPAG